MTGLDDPTIRDNVCQDVCAYQQIVTVSAREFSMWFLRKRSISLTP